MNNQNSLMLVNKGDNVAVALKDLKKGEVVAVNGQNITLLDDIAFGHKAALQDIAIGQNVIKYGFPIGHAVADIKKGNHVHTHNLKTNLSGVIEYKYAKQEDALTPQKPVE